MECRCQSLAAPSFLMATSVRGPRWGATRENTSRQPRSNCKGGVRREGKGERHGRCEGVVVKGGGGHTGKHIVAPTLMVGT